MFLFNKLKIIKNEPLLLMLVYFVSVLLVYRLPTIITSLYALLLAIIIYRTSSDIFWLVFLFLIESELGFIFPKVDIEHSFSLIKNSLFGNLYFSLIIIIILLFKNINVKSKYIYIARKEIGLLIIYSTILILAFGVYKVTIVFRQILPWILMFTVPKIIKDTDSLVRFFRMIFPFVFLMLISQIFYIYTGDFISYRLGGGVSLAIKSVEIENVKEALRPIYGLSIPFISLWGATYFLISQNKAFSRFYLLSLLFLSLFSVYITATRTWMVASLLIFLAYFIFSNNSRILNLLGIGFVALSFFFIINISPKLQKQLQLSGERYETLESFAEGDITAEGTSKRFDIRKVKPMKGFVLNPLLGWGVGEEFANFVDGHVGYHSLIMSYGVLGSTIWLLIWVKFFFLIYKARYRSENPKLAFLIITLGLSILIIHATKMWFGFLIDINSALILSVLYLFGCKYYSDTAFSEKYIKN